MLVLLSLALSSCQEQNLAGADSKGEEKSEVKQVEENKSIHKNLSDKQLLNSLAIHEGVGVEGVDLSFKPKLVAIEELENLKEPELSEKTLTFTHGEKTFSYSFKDLGYAYDYEAGVEKAYNFGRENLSEEDRLMEIKALKNEKPQVNLGLVLDEEVLKGKIAEMNESIHVPASFDGYSYLAEEDRVISLANEDGQDIDLEGLIALVNENKEDNTEIEIPIKVTSNNADADKIAESVNGVIGSAESTFNAGYWERCENIRISTEALYGVVIDPGATFSFNDWIGDTTYDKGYLETIVLEGTEEVPGMGGGVCQTSTALYHAALKSGMDILERHPHTVQMPYSPGGLDAAIEYGIIDLVVRNPHDFPVLIKTYYEPGYISFDIYGDTNKKDYEVTLHSDVNYYADNSTEYIYDDSLSEGSEVWETWGHQGSGWSAYRVNEATGEWEYLGDTHYPPVNNVIRRGP